MSSAEKQRQHLLQDDSSDGIEKGRLEALATQYTPAELIDHEHTPPLRRYWSRALVATFIPAIVAAYYGVIWLGLVQGIENDEAAKYRTFSGSLIFYSWFLIGVFVLSWSNYGLAGIEAAMLLRSRFWAVSGSHYHNTWSSPSGWIKAIRHWHFNRLWSLLAFVSILPYIGIPLSGLVFEITDGYIKTSGTASVQGRNSSTFNERYDFGFAITNQAKHTWLVGIAPTIPGFGVIYTNRSVDRSEHSDFGQLPNTLPLSESIPDLFLVPQADKPVSGKAWGLRIKYDCSIVRSASEFTVLNEKGASSIQHRACAPYGTAGNCFSLKTPSGNILNLWNSTGSQTFNVEAYYEVGLSGPHPGRYNGNFSDFEAEEGSTSTVIEYAAWQYRTSNINYEDTNLPFNATVEPSIQGMGSPFVKLDNGNYTVNNTFFTLQGDTLNGVQSKGPSTNASDLVAKFKSDNGMSRVIDVAPPIGVRCVASSGLGTAELDGVTSSFHDYERSDPAVDPVYTYGPYRFGNSAQNIIEKEEFSQHYISGGLPGAQPNENSNRYPQFVDGVSLLRSANLAYALEAFDLMYGIKTGFNKEWPEPGLMSSREGKILVIGSLIEGPFTGYAVLALLSVWAVLSMVLGAMYGFRKRPADTLEGYFVDGSRVR